jgi:hypothetical protein
MAVLAATTVRRGSVAANVEAAKPNHPNRRMNVPSMAMGMWWARSGRGLPSGPYLPSRGPSKTAPASAAMPPMAWTTPEPAKSTYPFPRSKLLPSWESQPPPQVHIPNRGK